MKTSSLVLSLLLVTFSLNAEEPADIKKISEAFGNFVGSSIVGPQQPIQYDIDSVILGIQKGVRGEPAPMTEQELQLSIQSLLTKAHSKLADENLVKAEAFLTKQASDKKITVAVPGRLHYEIIQASDGEEIKSDSQPTFEYKGTFLDGNEFGNSEVTGPITLPLDGVIKGLGEGLLGMKEGEERRFFIHPEYAYGTSGELPPNSLLIFEIKIVKANQPKEEPKETAELKAE